MLKIYKEFVGKSVSNSDDGDANMFLRNVLIEVVTENYRQLMVETLDLAGIDVKSDNLKLDPPLRANERVISGLFANAIARVAPRSRSEARIDRSELQSTVAALDSDFEEKPPARAGRVDYLAWYGQRIIAIELKAASINLTTVDLTQEMKRRWDTVTNQAKTAQNHLLKLKKADPGRYPMPVSLALMVVVIKCATSTRFVNELDDEIEASELKIIKNLDGLKPRSTFLATYTFPKECRTLVPRTRGHAALQRDNRVIYTPFVAFLARPAVTPRMSA